jgi:hypothetical protein
MRNQQVQELIQEFDAGNQSPLLCLKVFTELAAEAENRNGRGITKQDIEGWDIGDADALKKGIEYLRRKVNANTVNAR